MMNFYQIFTVLAENNSISLNTDILETGVLNILALIIILFLFCRANFFPVLKIRQKSIVAEVENTELRLKTAQENLSETQNLLNQVHLVIGEIKQETTTTKEALLQANAYETKKDLKTRFERALAVLRLKERQILLEIKQQIISLVLKRTVIRTKQAFETKNSARIFLNDTINKLQALEGVSL